MRTIKFRGKRLDNGKWAFGGLAEYIFADGKARNCVIYPFAKGNMNLKSAS